MAVQLRFDTAGNLEPVTLVLCYHSGDRIGVITNQHAFTVADNLGNPIELSFYINKEETTLWSEVLDMRLVWIPEWDKYFEIGVSLDDGNETVKNITAMHLPEYEMSHVNHYEIEINTDADIDREDYVKATVFYDPENPKASLLHRMTEKTPHIEIAHVDESLKKIQAPEFSFDESSYHEDFTSVAEQLGCLFVWDAYTDEDDGHTIHRTLSAYDLEANCPNCGYRGDYGSVCPDCGKELKPGYGEDTTIFYSRDNYADSISYETNKDAVKNCFRIKTGDELMDAAIQACNPNNTMYIWYFSPELKAEMSQSLRDALTIYDGRCQDYALTHEYVLSNIDAYKNLVTKYSNPFTYNNDGFTQVNSPVIGSSALSKILYDVIDMELYLTDSLMPSPTMGSEPSAQDQINTLVSYFANATDNTIGVNIDINSISLSTATNAIKGMAEVLVDSRFNVEVEGNSYEPGKWTGYFTVTSEVDKELTAKSGLATATINNNTVTYLRNKIQKTLDKGSNENFTISAIFKKDEAAFRKEMERYSLTNLENFAKSCEGVIAIIAEQNSKLEYNNVTEDMLGYYQKRLNILRGRNDANGNVQIQGVIPERTTEIAIVKSLKEEIKKHRSDTQKALNLEENLGTALWHEFCAFRREDTYNSSFISDGLTNAKLLEQAQDILDSANRELIKSATLQHSISATLKNFLIKKEFAPLLDHFAVGNWMRIEVDGIVYKLRLLSYEINFDDFENANITFSDVTKAGDVVSDINSIIANMKGIASTYGDTVQKAMEGKQSSLVVNKWVSDALDTTLVKIVNSADNQDIVYDENGLFCRKKNEFTGEYEPEQLRIINSTIVFTDNGWETIRTALGKFYYKDPLNGEEKVAYGLLAETLVGQLILGETLVIANSNNNMTFDMNGLVITNKVNTFTVNPNSNTLLSISNSSGNVFWVDANGTLHVRGDLDILSDSNFQALADDVKKNAEALADEIERAKAAETKAEENAVATANKYSDGQNTSLQTTLEDGYKTYADSAVSALDTAAAKLLGTGTSLVTDTVLIYPYIAGGYLNIANSSNSSRVIIDPNNLTGNNYIFQVHNGSMITMGVDKNGNTVFAGTVTATAGQLGNWLIHGNRIQSSSTIYMGKAEAGMMLINEDGKPFICGQNSSGVSTFSVSRDGVLAATGANISGIIDATDIKIKNKLYMYINENASKEVLRIDENAYGTDYVDFVVGAGTYNIVFKNMYGTLGSVFKNNGESPDWTLNGDVNIGKSLSVNTSLSVNGITTIYSRLDISNGGNIFMANGTAIYSMNTSDAEVQILRFNSDNQIVVGNTNYQTFLRGGGFGLTLLSNEFRPTSNETINLGNASNRWLNIYAKEGTIQTSDEYEKDLLGDITPAHESLFMALEPLLFRWKKFEWEERTPDRIHMGFGARRSTEIAEQYGFSMEDLAFLCKDTLSEPLPDGRTERYGIRYNELIPLNVHMTQKNANEIAELKSEIAELKNIIKEMKQALA